jgi:hypothetical protein
MIIGAPATTLIAENAITRKTFERVILLTQSGTYSGAGCGLSALCLREQGCHGQVECQVLCTGKEGPLQINAGALEVP